MYVPAFFKVSDRQVLEAFVKANSFATLVTNGDPYPQATHIPVELELNAAGQQVLWGHIARGNRQWKDFEKYPQVRVVYLSPVHGYISSSWYDHPNAPTWNYVSVQVTGRIRVLGEEEAWEQVRRLVNKYEKGSEHPVSLDGLPPSVQAEMKGLVAFEISIENWEAAYKLSQNRDDKNFNAIIARLEAMTDPAPKLLASLMKETRNASTR
ncbi:MAG: FMN-binding negative transcriptional regulator [Flavihumibacter sp.]